MSASVSGLKVNTVYHFSISATTGGTSEGADETFKTLGVCSGYCASLENYESSEVKLAAPDAVAVEASSGDFWVAESAQDRVLEFNPERKYVRQFGSAGAGNGQFNGIAGIATNASGDVYAIDSGNAPRAGVRPGRQIHHPVSRPAARALASTQKATSGWTPGAALGLARCRSTPRPGAAAQPVREPRQRRRPARGAYGMAFSGGHLYVAELSRVQEFSTSGEVHRGV